MHDECLAHTHTHTLICVWGWGVFTLEVLYDPHQLFDGFVIMRDVGRQCNITFLCEEREMDEEAQKERETFYLHFFYCV